jgi:predicted transcriptional regulator
MVANETAMRLLQATREQLHSKPTRQVIPFEVAEMAGVNPYQREYDEAVEYLVDNGYIEQYPNSSYSLYRMTNKGLKEILGNP